MIIFIILAAALTFVAAAVIAIPLLRRSNAVTQAPWTALAVVGVLGIGASALYATLSNWSWSKAAAAEDSPQAMVGRLARRVWHNPDDLSSWLLLGRSYMALQQTPLAVRAYERANRLADGKSAEALIGLAEALSVEDQSQLSGRAGQLIERALVLAPHSPKALFFGAAAALHRGELPLARERFAALLALNPPESVRPLIEQQVAAIDQELAAKSGSASAGEAASGTGSEAGDAPQSGTASQADSATQRAAVRIKVALSPKLQGERTGSAPLYVFVQDPKNPGPPLAVKRLETHFPQTVELTAADAMIAGRAIAPGEQVEVVARIARSGNPVAQKGDPFGEVAYRVGRDGVVDVIIDRLTP
jgi:cytochrome c-type biogenesis protein CcmH